MLAKAATDLAVASLLLDAVEGGPPAGSADRAVRGGTGAAGVEENLAALLSPPSATVRRIAAADRSNAAPPEDVEAARAEALTEVGDTLALVSQRAAKSGQGALGGLIGIGAAQVAGAIGQAGQGLANVLGAGATISRWYQIIRSYAVNAYETVIALLGTAAQTVSQMVVGWVNDLTDKWTGELKGGKLLAKWLEALYETEATKTAVGELAARSGAAPEKFAEVADEARRLRESYAQQIKWADKVLEWVPRLSGPVMLALPHSTLIVAVLYVALGGYVIVTGADYVDAPRLKILGRVSGVRQFAEGSLT